MKSMTYLRIYIDMLDNISINNFCDVSSSLRKMNPISKILCVLIFLILTFVDNSIQFNFILAIILIVAMLLSNVSFKIYFKILLSLSSFIFFIFLINFLCHTSINTSIILSLRLIFIVLYSSILTLTTTKEELIYGLEHILSPLKIFKVPVNSLALILTLAISFIPVVFETLKKIIKCYETRGISFKNLSFSLKISYIKSIIIPVFIKTFKCADNLSDTMYLKLYNSNSTRTDFYNYGYSKMDAYMLSLHFMLIIILIMKGIY